MTDINEHGRGGKPEWARELRARLSSLQLPPAREAEIIEELSQHLDDRLQELIAAAKTSPGKIAYASCGSGTPQHLSGELLRFMAGIQLIHVPYKGCAPSLADALAGQVPVLFNTVPNVMPHARSGRLRALAVTSGKRFPLVPELPTVAEAGLPGYDVDQWFAVLGPDGIPAPIVETLNREIVRVVSASALREKLMAQSFVPAPSSPDELAHIVRGDIARWSRLIQQVGIRVD